MRERREFHADQEEAKADGGERLSLETATGITNCGDLSLVLSYDAASGRYAAHRICDGQFTPTKPYSSRFNVAVRDNGNTLYLTRKAYRIGNSDIGAAEIVMTRLPDDFTPRYGGDGL